MVKIKDKIKALFKNKSFLIGAASFMLPALALYIIFIFNGVHPFGDKQILVTDLWHQYYPFLCEMQAKIQAGESLLYSENIGLGINFWALIAYYCASPLNFLIAFVTKNALRDLVVILVVLKVGFTGLFFSFYLRKVFNRYDKSTVVFSMMYALCGYVLGYYWNIMWHDCVALLPLVMLGVYSLIKEGKWKLYVISLAVTVVSNFYVGFMVCIFTAIYFFTECIKESMGFKKFVKKLGFMAVCSIAGLALTAFMTIPAYLALQNTVSVVPKTEVESEKGFFAQIGDTFGDMVEELGEDAPDVAGRFASFNEPVPKEGLPNLFSGFLSVMMLGVFLCSKNIKKREKIATSIMLVLLFLSITISNIDIIWHGFHKPNMVPYRYAFVFSFAMVTMAYRAYVAEFALGARFEKKNVFLYAVAGIISAVVIACAWNEAGAPTVLGCSALLVVYAVILLSIHQCREERARDNWRSALLYVIVLEMVINTVIAVPTVRTTNYTTYYYRGEEIERLLEDVDADESYGRCETSQEYILNDPALYGYKGVSTFTSTANQNVTNLMETLGICGRARSNRYYYQTTSPFTNALLAIEHVIFKNDMKNLNPYLEEVAAEWTADEEYKNVIYKNTATLPIGFMVSGELFAENALEGENAFEVQNSLFRAMTGLEGDLFVRVPLKTVSAESTVTVSGAKEGKYTLKKQEGKKPKLDLNYIAPDENSVYAYVDGDMINKIKVSNTTYKIANRVYVFPGGSYDVGEKFKFTFEFEDDVKEKESLEFHVYSLNEELFEDGIEILSDEAFEIEEYKSRKIKGKVNVLEDGVFYTSIPYEKGWKAYIDGEEADIEPFENALITLPLDEGEHEVVLKYTPYGFNVGVIISAVALIAVVLTIILSRRRKSNGQNIDSSSML